jgi:hypothetical protein
MLRLCALRCSTNSAAALHAGAFFSLGFRGRRISLLPLRAPHPTELFTMEVNLIRRTIEDLTERSNGLRGFL